MAEIVIRLDGLPLAIELAAAWCKALSIPALAARLERRLPLLSSGAGDGPSRHHTMRDAIAWSYRLLSPEEQELFRRLAVFSGGFTLEASEALDEPNTGLGTIARLSRLLDQSLVQATRVEIADVRYGMLATIREFAREQLSASDEETLACDRHAALFLELAESAAPYLHGPRQRDWLSRLDLEHDNLRAALDWTIAREHDRQAVRFGALLWLFWLKQGHWTEGRGWLRRVQALAGAAPADLHAEILLGAGSLAGIQGHLGEAEELFYGSLTKWRESGSGSGVARTLSMMSIAAVHGRKFDLAVSLLTEAMPLFDLPRDEPWAAHATGYLGFALFELGDVERGIALAEEGLSRLETTGEDWATANTSVMLGDILVSHGDHRRAATLFADGLAKWAAPGITAVIVWPLGGLARVASVAGNAVDAARLIGFLDAVTDRAGAMVDPYYELLVKRAAEATSVRLGEHRFEIERSAARSIAPDLIVPESLRIARDLVATL